MHDRKMNPAI